MRRSSTELREPCRICSSASATVRRRRCLPACWVATAASSRAAADAPRLPRAEAPRPTAREPREPSPGGLRRSGDRGSNRADRRCGSTIRRVRASAYRAAPTLLRSDEPVRYRELRPPREDRPRPQIAALQLLVQVVPDPRRCIEPQSAVLLEDASADVVGEVRGTVVLKQRRDAFRDVDERANRAAVKNFERGIGPGDIGRQAWTSGGADFTEVLQ